MTNKEIAKRFAEKRYGFNMKNGNNTILVDGDTIYSYGHHFPIAKVNRESKTFVFNEARYSVTTSRHKSAIYHELINAGYKQDTSHVYVPKYNPYTSRICGYEIMSK